MSTYGACIFILTSTILILLLSDIFVSTHQVDNRPVARSKRAIPIWRILRQKRKTNSNRYNRRTPNAVPYFNLEENPTEDSHLHQEEPLPEPEDYPTPNTKRLIDHIEYDAVNSAGSSSPSEHGVIRDKPYGRVFDYEEQQQQRHRIQQPNQLHEQQKPDEEPHQQSLGDGNGPEPPAMPPLEVYKYAGSYKNGDKWPYIVYQTFGASNSDDGEKNGKVTGCLKRTFKNLANRVKKLFSTKKVTNENELAADDPEQIGSPHNYEPNAEEQMHQPEDHLTTDHANEIDNTDPQFAIYDSRNE